MALLGRIYLLGVISILGTVGCDQATDDPLKNLNLQLRCAIDINDETLWIRNRNLVITKSARSSFKFVFGNPLEFHSRRYSPCAAPLQAMRDLVTETKLFLDKHGRDTRPSEAEEQEKIRRFVEDARDGVLDDAEPMEESYPGKPVHWTITLAYGPMEVVPATDVWPEQKRLKHELEYEINAADRSSLPPEFAALLKRFEELFPEIQSIDESSSEDTADESEIRFEIVE